MTTPQGNPYSQQANPYGGQQAGPYGHQPQPNPYAQQGGYPQQGGYAAPAAGYPQGGQAYPNPAAPAGQWAAPQGQVPYLACRFCGTAPAVDVTFRAHRGLLVMMTFRKLEGPMCHTCGMQVYKKLTTETLWQGWWSPLSLFLFTPLTLLWNVFASVKVRKLQAPVAARY
ncbi:hypothetical protein [Streptomyces hygroscopicus]|uniref:hypothetical protein n=1 Tax=Streptomyces hygroscopicus TaxID=1912 RepID=UPI00224004FA|nr:hypothetical protein [Streptomyces hygroscopicus]